MKKNEKPYSIKYGPRSENRKKLSEDQDTKSPADKHTV